jgi:hypothetical protein
MPIVEGSEPSPYSDTPTPRRFGTVSPLDPQLFSTIIEHTDQMLEGHSGPKYSPIEVAQWLEDLSKAATSSLETARRTANNASQPDFRRWEEDILIQAGIGSFFAAKIRSGTLYEIYLKTGSSEAGNLAVTKYAEAREAWAVMSKRAGIIYAADITYGAIPMRRGHWSDRLPNIDRDLEVMQAAVAKSSAGTAEKNSSEVSRAIQMAIGKSSRPSPACNHTEPGTFAPGQPLALLLQMNIGETRFSAVDLYYRHVNQGERWRSTPMDKKARGYEAAIPGDYTQSLYPLEYYFVLHHGNDSAISYPAFGASLSNQPYYAVWRRM